MKSVLLVILLWAIREILPKIRFVLAKYQLKKRDHVAAQEARIHQIVQNALAVQTTTQDDADEPDDLT